MADVYEAVVEPSRDEVLVASHSSDYVNDISIHFVKPGESSEFAKQSVGSSIACIVLTDIVGWVRDQSGIQNVHRYLREHPQSRVILVSRAAVHLGETSYLNAEKVLREKLHAVTSGIVVLRVASTVELGLENGPADERLEVVIQQECCRPRRTRDRTLTLLGPSPTAENQPYRKRHWFVGARKPTDAIDTLTPATVEDLLALYNPYNYTNVQLAGYNTGVQHFGWSFPGKTVVKTIATGKRIRLMGDRLHVDAGVTLKRAIQFLSEHNKEFLVIPNYSYISMGTCFFVPIHGSGSEVSNLGDTIEKALLYLPEEDRFLSVKRGDEQFARYLYFPGSNALVLRLTFRVRDRSRYFMKEAKIDQCEASDLVRELNDPEATNVEIRKSQAADDFVTVRKYYEEESGSGESGDELLEFPKDSLGRIWDRLEETPVVSQLFHHFVKRYGYHIELFLDEDEFHQFWQSHDQLPLRKIQLRRMRRDGMLHSPCRDSDRISADLFMRRADKTQFLDFIERQLPNVRFNPGKHSK